MKTYMRDIRDVVWQYLHWLLLPFDMLLHWFVPREDHGLGCDGHNSLFDLLCRREDTSALLIGSYAKKHIKRIASIEAPAIVVHRQGDFPAYQHLDPFSVLPKTCWLDVIFGAESPEDNLTTKSKIFMQHVIQNRIGMSLLDILQMDVYQTKLDLLQLSNDANTLEAKRLALRQACDVLQDEQLYLQHYLNRCACKLESILSSRGTWASRKSNTVIYIDIDRADDAQGIILQAIKYSSCAVILVDIPLQTTDVLLSTKNLVVVADDICKVMPLQEAESIIGQFNFVMQFGEPLGYSADFWYQYWNLEPIPIPNERQNNKQKVSPKAAHRKDNVYYIHYQNPHGKTVRKRGIVH